MDGSRVGHHVPSAQRDKVLLDEGICVSSVFFFLLPNVKLETNAP